MNKTLSVSLHGQNFFIEEDAHEKLETYLKTIKQYCDKDANADEVMADMESSIAEKFKTSLSQYKNTITLNDVENVIQVMGSAEDLNHDAAYESNMSDRKDERDASQTMKRKLYRDTDNGMIAGVASGLGVYFDIDAVLIRIAFLIFLFLGGSAILVYLLLWIVMSEAKTTAQKLEMHGQSGTIAAFKEFVQAGKKVKEKFTTCQSCEHDTKK